MPSPTLPPELISHILSFLISRADSSTYPSPELTSLQQQSSQRSQAKINTAHLQDLRNACLLSRSILPYARRLLYRSIVITCARQMRLLARTLDGKSIARKTEEKAYTDEYEGVIRPYSSGSLIHPDMLLALSPMTFPGEDPSRITQNDAGDATDGDSDISMQLIRETAEELSLTVQHVCLLHYDACLASSDDLTDTYAWGPSLRSLFTRARNMRTLSFFARPNGQAMEQIFNAKTTCKLSRLSIQLLGDSEAKIGKDKPSEPMLSHLTHLHLNQTVPTGEIISQLISTTTCTSSLQVLRLSRVSQDGLFHLAEEFERLKDAAQRGVMLDEQTPRINYARAAMAAMEIRRAQASSTETLPPSATLPHTWGQRSNRQKLQHFLFHFLAALQHFPHLRAIILELGDCGLLDPPPPPTRRFANMVGTPVGEQFVTQSSATSVPFGQLATLDFPTDIPLGIDEAQAWDAEEERRRTMMRDAYWLDVRHGKEALKEFVEEQVNRVVQERKAVSTKKTTEAAHMQQEKELFLEPSVFRPEGQGVEIRVVAPRPGGWNRYETLADFETQATHLNSDQFKSAERSSFSDPDVFQLAEERSELGYAPVPQSDSTSFSVFASDKVPKYWLGVLPRVRAAEGLV